MKRVCVFAGSNAGVHPKYKEHARALGKELVKRGCELVYGGSNAGLMGEVANAVLHNGGKVTGVIPKGLFRSEVVHQGLTDLIEVADMHERKATMGELADAYIALPGGYGTFEELFEVISWAQLGIHDKPIGLLNSENYYVPLMRLVDHAVTAGFVQPAHTELIVLGEDSHSLLSQLEHFRPPLFSRKWSAGESTSET